MLNVISVFTLLHYLLTYMYYIIFCTVYYFMNEYIVFCNAMIVRHPPPLPGKSR